MTTSSATSSSSPISQIIDGFFNEIGISTNLPEASTRDGAYADLIRDHLKVSDIERGRITCILDVQPLLSNVYGTLHGGAVSAVAELVSVACVKTVTDKDLFLGELSTCYLSAALINAQLEISGFIVRRGRNVTVNCVEFRNKETRKLVYTARATFYSVPVSNLIYVRVRCTGVYDGRTEAGLVIQYLQLNHMLLSRVVR